MRNLIAIMFHPLRTIVIAPLFLLAGCPFSSGGTDDPVSSPSPVVYQFYRMTRDVSGPYYRLQAGEVYRQATAAAPPGDSVLIRVFGAEVHVPTGSVQLVTTYRRAPKDGPFWTSLVQRVAHADVAITCRTYTWQALPQVMTKSSYDAMAPVFREHDVDPAAYHDISSELYDRSRAVRPSKEVVCGSGTRWM